MPGNGDALEGIWNIDLQLEQGQKLIDMLAKVKAAIIDTNASTGQYKKSGGDKAATDALIASNNQLAASQKALLTTSKQLEAQTRAEKKAQADLSNEYKQAGIIAKELKERAYQYYTTLGAGSPITKQAIADSLDFNNKLKLFDAQVGVTNRNVGNYHGSLITLSKGIKGLGGLGVLLSRALGIDPETAMAVKEAGRALREYHHVAEEAKIISGQESAANIAQATTTNIAKDATNTYTIATEGAAVAEIEMAAATDVATTSLVGLRTALIATGIGALIIAVGFLVYKFIEWNDEAEKANERIKFMNELNGKAAKQIADESVHLTVLKTKIEDVNLPMKVRLQSVKDIKEEYPKYFEGLTNEQILTGKVGDAYDRASAAIIRKARAMAAEQELQEIAKKKLDILNEANERQRKVGEQTGAGVMDDDEAKKLATTSYNQFAKRKQTEIDELNRQQTFLIDFVKQGAEETTKIDDEKVDKASKNAKKLTDIYSSLFDVYKLYQQKLIDSFKETADDESKSFEERIAALRHYTNAKEILSDAEFKQQENIIREKLALDIKANKGNDAEISRLVKNANQHIIYIEEQANVARLQNEADFFKAKAKLAEQFSKSNGKQVEAQAQNDSAKQAEHTKEYIDAQKEKYALEKELAQKSFELIQNLVDAGYTRQKNAIQDLINANNEYSAAETERINQSTLNEQDKAARLIQLQASTNEKNKQFAKEQKDIDIKKAQFDKEASIAKIILNTAVQVSEHLGNPVIVALIAALGAAELAIAIATPIPRYAKGGVHGGGPMIAGELGTELMIDPDGSTSLTPGTATRMNAKAGTRIIPHDETMRLLMNGMIVGGAMQQEQKDTAIEDAVMKAAGLTIAAIKGQRTRHTTKVNIDPRWAGYLGQQIYGKA